MFFNFEPKFSAGRASLFQQSRIMNVTVTVYQFRKHEDDSALDNTSSTLKV